MMDRETRDWMLERAHRPVGVDVGRWPTSSTTASRRSPFPAQAGKATPLSQPAADISPQGEPFGGRSGGGAEL